MNTLLLIFFAIPIAVIIVSIALQKIFKCPFLVAAIIFAIFLVITFIVGNLIFLVATIAYTILAFITAVITKISCRIIRELDRRDLLTISSNGCNGVENELLTISTNCRRNNNDDNDNDNDDCSCGCNCNTSNDSIAVRANVFPNNTTNGRSGSFCGCFRRR